jgi:hypothetical protein
MSHDVRICPECGDEYTLSATECADCRVPLVFEDEIEPASQPASFPPTAELACVRTGPLPWTRALSAALEESGIAHRVEPDTRTEAEGGLSTSEFDGADVFGTWVTPSTLDTAKEIDALVFAHVHGQDEAAPAASSDEVCPACETPIAVDALECSDCGLNFA